MKPLQGKQIRVTLNDGSVLDLNSGSRIVYPSIFVGKERRIQLYGEAMFDVKSDADRPFIVETFACDVKVLGTHFNVIADEAKNLFSTALFRGKVAVLNHSSNESVLMTENSVINLKNGHLQIAPIEDPDEYRWPEGIITLNRMSFNQITEKLEKYYDVKIIIERSEMPVIKYQSCKIRVSDGTTTLCNMPSNGFRLYIYLRQKLKILPNKINVILCKCLFKNRKCSL